MSTRAMYNELGELSDRGQRSHQAIDKLMKAFLAKHARGMSPAELRDLERVFHRAISFSFTMACLDKRMKLMSKKQQRGRAGRRL